MLHQDVHSPTGDAVSSLCLVGPFSGQAGRGPILRVAFRPLEMWTIHCVASLIQVAIERVSALDLDKDGYTNIGEFINDTDPTEFIDYRKPENNVHSLHREDTIHRKRK